MTKEHNNNSTPNKTKAFAVGDDGTKVPIESNRIEFEFTDGRRIAIDVQRAISDSSIMILAGRAIASREDVEAGMLVVRASAGNVLHVTLEGGHPINAPSSQETSMTK